MRGLLSSAQGIDQEAVRRLLFGIFVTLKYQVESFLGSGGSLGEQVSERTERAADFLIVANGNWRTLIDRGRDQLIVVRNLPEDFAVRDPFDFLFCESRNFLIPVHDQAEAVSA